MVENASLAYMSLLRKIHKSADGNGDCQYSPQELEGMVHAKYESGKLCDAEYAQLCTLIESIF